MSPLTLDTLEPTRPTDLAHLAPLAMAHPGSAPAAASAPADAPVEVAFLHCGELTERSDHDLASKESVSGSLAALLGLPYAGPRLGPRAAGALAAALDQRTAQQAAGATGAGARSGRPYLVPSETLLAEEALQLGIHGEDDFFGGVVPEAFMATKVISHGLVDAGAEAPAAWCEDHAHLIREAVLPGYTVFDAGDAWEAAKLLLAGGRVRLKRPDGVGGLGQLVIDDLAGLQRMLDEMGEDELARQGLVLERNLNSVDTFSVGQVNVRGLTAAYIGRQTTTTDRQGREVYGGSTLLVSRGTLKELMHRPMRARERLAVEQALTYHEGARRMFPGLLLSRANYDIAQGVDDQGRWRSGVLEQSWRIGGASGAELAALHAFQADPDLQRVWACTVELHVDDPQLPPGATLHYDGVGADTGRLMKYAQVRPHVDD